MNSRIWDGRHLLFALCLLAIAMPLRAEEALRPQYEFGDIRVPGMSANEPKREQVSVQLATTYLDQGSLAWKGSRKCVTGHTTEIYMAVRPALVAQLGKPLDEMRTFATPETWGSGNRAAKLKNEPEFTDPPSDGHQTGLAIIVLRDAGVAPTDERVQRGVAWILANQRSSGRWWTRSLNTDTYHFIAYSGTAFPLLALAKCHALPSAWQGG